MAKEQGLVTSHSSLTRIIVEKQLYSPIRGCPKISLLEGKLPHILAYATLPLQAVFWTFRTAFVGRLCFWVIVLDS